MILRIETDAVRKPMAKALDGTLPASGDPHARSVNQYFGRKTAARYIGFAPQTLAQWACNKRVLLPFAKIGTKVLYRKADLDAFLNVNRQDQLRLTDVEVPHG